LKIIYGLLKREGAHQDKRSDSNSKKKIIPEKYKEVAIDVISERLDKGIPVTAKTIRKALIDVDSSLKFSLETLYRTLKSWNLS